MTIKQLAFDTQQYLQSQTSAAFKRSHIYELLAASFGFNSYASFSAEYVFTQGGITSRRPAKYSESVGRRTLELDYPVEAAIQLAQALPNYLAGQDIGVIRITDLVAHLRYSSNRGAGDEPDESDEDAQGEEDAYGQWLDRESIATPILLEGLKLAGEKGDANAHYALALIYDPDDDFHDEPVVGGDYWYKEERRGRVLSDVEKGFANAYAATLVHSEHYEHHLRAAGALGHEVALLELAERFGDPSFFERRNSYSSRIDAVHVAGVAEHLGRFKDARQWLAIAAQQGDTEAMRELIESYDRSDMQQCWSWFYLAELLGVDLAKDDYRAIHGDGSDYDDDVGGTVFVDGRDGVKLEPINADQDAAARQVAVKLHRAIETYRSS